MADIFDQALGVLSAVAPALATAFGGPLAGQAVGAIEAALGLSATGSKDAASAALLTATPDQLLALKKADQDFQAKMAELGVELEKLAAGDRDSARRREVEAKDRTPAALAFLMTLGFFGTLVFMLLHPLPKDVTGGEAFLLMLGSLTTGFSSALMYFFGSTSSSRTKDQTISSLSK